MPDPYREPADETSPPSQGAKIEAPVLPGEKEQIAAPEKIEGRPMEIPAPGPSQATAAPMAPSPPPAPLVTPSPAPTAAPPQDSDKDRQLKMLVDLAFAQGIDKAVEVAKASGNPYLIDEFHDTLVDELRQQLVDKGKLKEV